MGTAPDNVDEAIDRLGSTPTTDQLIYDPFVKDFDERALAASAMARVLAGGGGPVDLSAAYPAEAQITCYLEPSAQTNFGHVSFAASHPIRYADGVDGAFAEWPVRLGEGTWAVDFGYVTHTGSAIITFSLNDGSGHVDIDGSPYSASNANVDTYSAAPSDFIISRVCDDLTVPDSADYTLRIRNNGKNASSSNFETNVHYVWLRRIGV